MKVLVVNNASPFVRGGAEELADQLCRQLELRGCNAELLRLPFQWEPIERVPSQMLMARWCEPPGCDVVIALKFPAYLVRHERKVLWVLHQFRQVYDLWDGTPTGEVGTPIESVAAAVREADRQAFAESREVFVNSEVTRDRMVEGNGVEPQILRPPVNDPEAFGGGAYGDYVFAGGRINSMKRQHLLIEAMQHTNPRARLIVAGPPDSQSDGHRLEQLVETLGLANRVQLDLRRLPRSEYAAYVNGAAAVAYLPVDEDSLGYVAMEAATARRPLITCSDSGGILGLVCDGETGWIGDPNPKDLARTIDSVYSGVSLAGLGSAAREKWLSYGVTWDRTIEALLA
jgi:glycosyltransferase involved in cell wall biosynthesis